MSGSFCLICLSLIIYIIVPNVRCQSHESEVEDSNERPVVPEESELERTEPENGRVRLKGLCRDGWSPGTMKDFSGKEIPICLKINPEALTWSEAQESCRKDYGFLMKFDSRATLDDRDLLTSVIYNGITKFWTGMNSENGHLIWDDLIPNQVRPHNRLNDTSVPERPWIWESSIPEKRHQYCGQMKIHTEDDRRRRKRSSDDDSSDSNFPSFDLSTFGNAMFNNNFRRSSNIFPPTSAFQSMLTRTQMSDQLELPGTLGLQSEHQIPGSGLLDANIQNGGLATNIPTFEPNGNFEQTDTETVTPFATITTGDGFNSDSNEMSISNPEGLLNAVKDVAANIDSNIGDLPTPTPTEAAETLRNLIQETAENMKADNTDSVFAEIPDSFGSVTTVTPPTTIVTGDSQGIDELSVGKFNDIPVVDNTEYVGTNIDSIITDKIMDDTNTVDLTQAQIMDVVNTATTGSSDDTKMLDTSDTKSSGDALLENIETVLDNHLSDLQPIDEISSLTDDLKPDDSLGFGQLTDLVTNEAIKEAINIDAFPEKRDEILSDILVDSKKRLDEISSEMPTNVPDETLAETESRDSLDTVTNVNENAHDQTFEPLDNIGKVADDTIATEEDSFSFDTGSEQQLSLENKDDSTDLFEKNHQITSNIEDLTEDLNGDNSQDFGTEVVENMNIDDVKDDVDILVRSEELENVDYVNPSTDESLTPVDDVLDTSIHPDGGNEMEISEFDNFDEKSKNDDVFSKGLDDDISITNADTLDDVITDDVREPVNTDFFEDMAERIGLSSDKAFNDGTEDIDTSPTTEIGEDHLEFAKDGSEKLFDQMLPDTIDTEFDTGNENFDTTEDSYDNKSDGNIDGQSKRDSDWSEFDLSDNEQDTVNGIPTSDTENFDTFESVNNADSAEDRFKVDEEFDGTDGASDLYENAENEQEKDINNQQENVFDDMNDFEGDDLSSLKEKDSEVETDIRESDFTDSEDITQKEPDWELETEIPDTYFEDKEERDRFDDIPDLAEDVVESDKKIALVPEIESKEIQLSSCEVKLPSVCFGYEVEVMDRASTCEDGWYGHVLLDTCYQILETRVSYREAVSTCKARSARLVLGGSQFERQFVLLAVQKEGRLFRGAKFWMESSFDKLNCKFFDERGVGTMQSCNKRLNAVCVKDARSLSVYTANNMPVYGTDVASYTEGPAEQRTFFSGRTDNKLPCKLTSGASEFPVLWFKDGVLVETKDKYISADISLYLNDELVSSIAMVTDRHLATPALQGEYWCEVWDRQTLTRKRSRSFNIRFSDVIAFHGSMEVPAFAHKDELLFNMANRKFPELTAAETDIKKVFNDVLPLLQTRFRDVIDVFTYIDGIRSNPNVIEYHTYFTLNRDYQSADEDIVYNRLKALLRTKLGNRYYMASLPGQTALAAFRTMSLQSTVSCPAATLQTTRDLYGHTIPAKVFSFPKAGVGEYANSIDKCSITNQLPSGSARCLGDFYTGAYWGEVVANQCIEEADIDDFNNQIWGVSPYTDKLTEIAQVTVDARNVEQLVSEVAQIAKVAPKFTPTDINKIADVLDHTTQVRNLPQQVGENVLKTVDRLMAISENEAHVANVETKAANRIIKSIERYAENADMGTKDQMRMVSDNVVVEIWNLKPSTKPVIGLAAETRGTGLDKPFKTESIATVYNKSQLYEANVDAAIELPNEVFSMKEKGDLVSDRLTMMVFRKNKLFKAAITDGGRKMNPTEQQLSNLNSYVISASIAGKKLQNLTEKVKTIFKPIKGVESSRSCVWWDFEMNNFKGGWSSKGCVYDGQVNGRDVCLCDHLTNFAVLIDFYGQGKPIPDHHELPLSIITMLGLSCSILGLSLTIISYLFFRKLRQGRAQQTLFNLSLSLLLSMLVFLVGVKQTHNYYGCIAVAILLHYLILVSFMWMLMEAILQYLTFVKILGTYITRFTMKTVLPAWGLPLIPVIAVLGIDYTLYKGGPDYCWMDLPAFYYAFAIPVTCIIVINIVIFVVTIASIFGRGKGLRSNQKKQKMAMTNLQAAITSFILLGLTWIFGYLAISDARLPFQYVFTILNSLQGFFIFILFVVRKKKVREQWYFICCKGIEKDRVSRSLSASNSIPSTYSNGSNRNSRKDGRERDRSDSTKTVQSTYSNSSNGFTNYGYDHGYDFPFSRYDRRAFRKF